MHISSLFSYTYKLEEVLHSAHPSFFAGGLSFLPNFQKGGEGLTGPQRCSCHIKNKLKSEILNDKESLKGKIFFSIITKN